MKRIIFVASVLVLSAVSHADEAGEVSIGDRSYSFFDLLKFSHADQSPLTPREMAEASVAIVQGKVASISPGRELYHIDDLPNTPPLKTAIIEIDVGRVIKGDVGDRVYFEYVVGGIPADILDKARYQGDVMIFLKENAWSDEFYTIIDSVDRQVDQAVTLYSLTRDSAFFIEDQAIRRVRQPLLEREDDNDYDSPVSSFEVLEDVLQLRPHIPDELKSAIEEKQP
jgi:hypothetical protein